MQYICHGKNICKVKVKGYWRSIVCPDHDKPRR